MWAVGDALLVVAKGGREARAEVDVSLAVLEVCGRLEGLESLLGDAEEVGALSAGAVVEVALEGDAFVRGTPTMGVCVAEAVVSVASLEVMSVC